MSLGANTSRFAFHDFARLEIWALKLTGGAANTLTVTLGDKYIDTSQGSASGLQRNNTGVWNIYFKQKFLSTNDMIPVYARSGTPSGDEITFYYGSLASGILEITNRLSNVATDLADGEVIDLLLFINRSNVSRK